MSAFVREVEKMRASRLLTIMMMLQTKGRLSAETLAGELEVSVRTIYRDIDQLSAAGVPVYADVGRNGGFALLEGWRTRLTGLTPPEAKALFLAGLPGPAAELGLGDAMADAELKLLAALPPDWQEEAQRVSSRFHLDPRGWFQAAETVQVLRQVADAVWSERQIAVTYASWTKVAERVLEPLGLVLKSGLWYMVAQSEGQPRTYRLEAVRALALTDATFVRPKDFDLAAYWAASTAQFEKDVYVGRAEIRASATGISRLKDLNATYRTAIEANAEQPAAGGWVMMSLPIEETAWTARLFTRIGAEMEVLSPPELRAEMARIAREMSALYA
jgi:predicted DNA-binding transcriptional regulator YafY